MKILLSDSTIIECSGVNARLIADKLTEFQQDKYVRLSNTTTVLTVIKLADIVAIYE